MLGLFSQKDKKQPSLDTPVSVPVVPDHQDKIISFEEQHEEIKTEDTKKALLNILEDARELEQQIQNEKNTLAAIVESIGEGLIVVDHTHTIQLMNSTAESILETTCDSCKGISWNSIVKIYNNTQLIKPEDSLVSRMFETKKQQRAIIDDNVYFELTTGKRFPVAFSVSPTTIDGNVVNGVIVFHDITHEKEQKQIIENKVKERTEELRIKNDSLEKAQIEVSKGWLEAQREKARLAASINSLPIGYILTDKDGNIFLINSTAKTIVGLQQDIFNISTLQVALGTTCNLNDLLSKTKDTLNIVRQHDILMNTQYLNITVVPILLEKEKEFIGTAIVIEDITERKVTDRARDEFFSIASHELRTPLTSIRGNTAMIIQYFNDMLKDNKELTEMIEDIHASSVRLIQIVNDFLNVSRLEMKKMTYKYTSFDLRTLIEKVHKELESTAIDKHDHLDLHVSQSIPNAYADPDRVKEVLLNLIGNAIKFTDNGGVTTAISLEDDCVRVEITDSGLGIPKERQDLLFRKFQQAGENLYTRDTAKSSGLGLYISKLMIEEMKGNIGLLRSEEGKGSTFYFTLPTTKTPSPSAPTDQG